MTQRMTIPAKGKTPQSIFKEMDQFKKNDYQWDKGKVFCLTYPVDDKHHEFLKDAYGKFIGENFLNPAAFESLKTMEREVVQMSLNLLNGGEDAVGTMTTGGTESILMAVKAAREYAKKHRPWVLRPELVCPESTHVAFEKACKYFGVKYVKVKLDADYRVNLKAYKKAINRNTIMLVGSAPQYPQGVIDPIEDIAKIAKKKKLPFHVDACVGGFMLPWLEKIGESIPLFDFRVDGVTSISADLHKYGFAAKGASVIMYKSMDYMKHQFFITTNWSGGIYASPNLPGTRPGGAIAAAWATLNKLGEAGYIEQAKRTVKVAKEFRKEISAIDGLEICGAPLATLHAFKSSKKELNIYAVADILTEKGWFFDRQQFPASIHMTIMPLHETHLKAFVTDLKGAVKTVLANPELAHTGNAAMYGMMAKLPVRGLVKKSVEKVMESMWGRDGQLPNFEDGGASDENSPLWMKLADKYGPQLMKGYDKVLEKKEELKSKLIP